MALTVNGVYSGCKEEVAMWVNIEGSGGLAEGG